MLDRETIKKWAIEIGFDAVGLTPARHLAEQERLFRGWLERGNHSSLEYLTRNIEKRFDPRKLVDGARTVIVCAVGYKNAISEGYPASCRTKIASYACNRDYHTTIKEMLHQLLAHIRETNPSVTGRAFVDSAPIAEKRFAVEAGLGWIGRQSLLIHPTLGSWLHLGELVLTAEAESYDRPIEGVGCGECRRCIEHCPTQAILGDQRAIDTARCIACHTIEQQPTTQLDLHGWIFGCDACQQCCPYNHRATTHKNALFTPLFDPRTLTPAEWLSMDEETFHNRFGTTPLLRTGLHRIQAMIKSAEQA